MSEQEPIKIIISVEEEPPLKAERVPSGPGTVARDSGRRAAVVAKALAEKAWNSDAGRKAARKLQEASDRGVRYVGTHAAEQQAKQTAAAVQERIKDTDWQQEAKIGLVGGLKWLSSQLAEAAQRVGPGEPKEKSPADVDPSGEA
jgi:hypothetical protein